jgi:hypothetical protein
MFVSEINLFLVVYYSLCFWIKTMFNWASNNGNYMCIALTKNHEYTHIYSMFLIIIIIVNHNHNVLKENGLVWVCDVFFHLNALLSSLRLSSIYLSIYLSMYLSIYIYIFIYKESGITKISGHVEIIFHSTTAEGQLTL